VARQGLGKEKGRQGRRVAGQACESIQ
jgi:hypothetical protein